MPADIFKAALEDQPQSLAAILGANPSQIKSKDPDADGRTALHHAASVGSLGCVQAILNFNSQLDTNQRVDLNATDGLGFTPLIVAASAGKLDVVRELLGGGADIQAANSRGATALHYAASKAWVDIGKLLIQKGADINARDKANQLPLHRAASVGSTAFLKLLLNPQLILPDTSSMPKPRLNLQDRAGNTPLHLAIESGHGEAACILIEAGCDRHRTNADGQRAEELDVIGGTEGRKLKAYINDRVGKLSD